jgi:CheY-like chemotaxis protein
MHVDDIAETREAVRKLLASDDSIEVIYGTGSSHDALEAYQILKPDIVLQDIHRPDMDGLTMTDTLRHNDPAAQVLYLTVDTWLPNVRAAMRLGARGFLAKPASQAELSDAVYAIHKSPRDASFYFGEGFWFNLQGDFVPGVELQELRGLRTLKEGTLIEIHGLGDTGRSVRRTNDVDLGRVISLDLDDVSIGTVDTRMLERMVSLVYLHLPKGSIDQYGIKSLSGLPRLRHFVIGDAVVVSRWL